MKLADPAGYSDDVGAHVNTAAMMDNLISQLDWTYRRALEAEEWTEPSRIQEAFAKWSLILKEYFSAYR